LQWGLWTGPVDLAPLRVLQERRLDWDGCRVDVRILGASHAITLTKDGFSATELLTCVAPPEGPRDRLAGPGDRCLTVGPWCWRVALRHAPLEPIPGGRWLLESAFPGHPQARTVVALDPNPGALVVRSYHAYPEDGAALLGEGEIRWRDDPWDI